MMPSGLMLHHKARTVLLVAGAVLALPLVPVMVLGRLANELAKDFIDWAASA